MLPGLQGLGALCPRLLHPGARWTLEAPGEQKPPSGCACSWASWETRGRNGTRPCLRAASPAALAAARLCPPCLPPLPVPLSVPLSLPSPSLCLCPSTTPRVLGSFWERRLRSSCFGRKTNFLAPPPYPWPYANSTAGQPGAKGASVPPGSAFVPGGGSQRFHHGLCAQKSLEAVSRHTTASWDPLLPAN